MSKRMLGPYEHEPVRPDDWTVVLSNFDENALAYLLALLNISGSSVLQEQIRKVKKELAKRFDPTTRYEHPNVGASNWQAALKRADAVAKAAESHIAEVI